ncbi:alpha-E domain-containing protein [Ideonella sp. YS5]|uniref:alpha-E domain-containing protein n=1 Tax=Ideonella sp. YS5 TaxID=3453714 RepID=UPI003EEC1664
MHMLSRTADRFFWMARYMERAVQAQSACGEATTRPHAPACAVFSAMGRTA